MMQSSSYSRPAATTPVAVICSTPLPSVSTRWVFWLLKACRYSSWKHGRLHSWRYQALSLLAVPGSRRWLRRGTGTVHGGSRTGEGRGGGIALSGDLVPATAEHGRGLKIINAVVDNLQLTGNEREGTTVRFEKTLEWLPGAAGQHLFSGDE